MTKLIALSSTEWPQFIKNMDLGSSDFETLATQALANHWQIALENVSEPEVAIFLPSLLESRDLFPASFRRFIQVGGSQEEKNRNAFELCFEKGYNQILFADYFSFEINSSFIELCFSKLDQSDVIFVPFENGGLGMVGMNLNVFPLWTNFAFSEPNEIVEMLSHCLEKNISYSILDPIELKKGKNKLMASLQTPKVKINKN